MPFLSEDDRRFLLELARRAIAEAVSLRRPVETIPRGGVFSDKRGVFVTLHVSGRLRGCIGVVEAFEPLGEAVVRCATGAALHDPRFPPVRADEIPRLRVEISLLSPLEPVLPENVEIGRHGLLISQGGRRGVLLPQVAVEHELGRDEFLGETCRKAGLPAKAWEEQETQILGFTCEIFAEDENAGEQDSVNR
jgi:AmmeMemoRadiSam system protein A